MKNRKTVGEESVEWAEKYWHLDKHFKGEFDHSSSESCSYDFFREVFIKAINGNIDDRLNPPEKPENPNIIA